MKSITIYNKLSISFNYLWTRSKNGLKMAVDLSESLVIGVSTRALFDLEKENLLFEKEGVEAYARYQTEHENEILERGSAFPLIQSLLQLNEGRDKKLVEVVIMSRNSPDTGIRVFNSIEHYHLDISRVALTGGKPLSPYIKAFEVDLFLSRDRGDVQRIIDDGDCAAALIFDTNFEYENHDRQVKIAFDADAVLFSEDSEYRYKTKGMDAFQQFEKEHENLPMEAGPFAGLMYKISKIQQLYGEDDCPIRVAIVTSRSAPAHLRVIKTLRSWGVQVNEAYFMGGMSKQETLKSFGAHIFFDDQDIHLKESSPYVPSGKVLYPTNSKMNQLNKEQNKNHSDE